MLTTILQDGEAEVFLCQTSGHYQILVQVYGGSELTLQVSADETAWVDTNITFSDVGIKRFGMAEGFRYRLNADSLAGARAFLGTELNG